MNLLIKNNSELNYYNIAVPIPCLKEESSKEKVIKVIRIVLLDTHIYVYDNNSIDQTVQFSTNAEAIVRTESYKV